MKQELGVPKRKRCYTPAANASKLFCKITEIKKMSRPNLIWSPKSSFRDWDMPNLDSLCLVSISIPAVRGESNAMAASRAFNYVTYLLSIQYIETIVDRPFGYSPLFGYWLRSIYTALHCTIKTLPYTHHWTNHKITRHATICISHWD